MVLFHGTILIKNTLCSVDLSNSRISKGVFSKLSNVETSSTPWASEEGARPQPGFWKLPKKRVVFVVASGKKQISPLCPPTKIFEKTLVLPLEKILPTTMFDTREFRARNTASWLIWFLSNLLQKKNDVHCPTSTLATTVPVCCKAVDLCKNQVWYDT